MTLVIASYTITTYLYITLKTLKYILGVVALVSILFHSGAYTAVYLDFQFNQSYIASNLCVNRLQPALKCEGKCYLKKQLSQQEQNTDKGVLTIQETLLWVYDAHSIEAPSILAKNTAAPVAFYQSLHPQHHAAPRPHPPCLKA